jgi:hypothetical protein
VACDSRGVHAHRKGARQEWRKRYTPGLKLLFPSLLFSKKKKINFKIFLTFFTFYILSTIFYYYLNEKTHYNTNFYFSLFHINYFNFISHQFYFSIVQNKNPKKRGMRSGFWNAL